jgi:hypothetical protein
MSDPDLQGVVGDGRRRERDDRRRELRDVERLLID